MEFPTVSELCVRVWEDMPPKRRGVFRDFCAKVRTLQEATYNHYQESLMYEWAMPAFEYAEISIVFDDEGRPKLSPAGRPLSREEQTDRDGEEPDSIYAEGIDEKIIDLVQRAWKCDERTARVYLNEWTDHCKRFEFMVYAMLNLWGVEDPVFNEAEVKAWWESEKAMPTMPDKNGQYSLFGVAA